MLGYICKYAPVEIFESMGVQMERIEPDVTNFNQAEIRMHPNICSFAKGVLEEVMSGEYEGVTSSSICWIRPGSRRMPGSSSMSSGSGL